MRARSLVTSLVIGLAVLATASPRAFAQSASVQAQSLFDDGRKLIKAGKIAEACTAFESSQKLDPAVTTLLNLAECREQNHQLATAWGAFVEANRMARASKNAKLARVASNHARKLEPRLSKLTITVAADRQVLGLEILRGDEQVNPAGWNHALPIDGGTYTITARAPGHTPWSVTRTIKPESDAQTVEVPRLVEAKPVPVATGKSGVKPTGGPPVAGGETGSRIAPPRTARPGSVASRGDGEPPAVPSRSSPPATDQPTRSRSLVLPIALGAGALALGGAALAFNISGDNTYDRAKASTDPAERDSLYHSANTRRYLAEGCGVAALGMAGAAVYFYFRGRGERDASTAMAPVVSPQLAGIAVIGHW